MRRKFGHLGILSGITGAPLPPCVLQEKSRQAPSAPARQCSAGVDWGVGGNLWLHVNAVSPLHLSRKWALGQRAPGTLLGVSSQLLQWVPGELAGVSGASMQRLQVPI